MHDLESSLTHIRGAWTAGRSALVYCPPEWRGAIDGANAECALAALAGHAAEVLFRPAPTTPPAPRSLLPELALPTLPEPLRPRARRLLATQKGRGLTERHFIDFIGARGHAMHPADWMPSPRDDWAPDAYAPWLDWIRGEDKPFPPPSFTLAAYERWSPAMRRAALVALRAADPGAARAIIAANTSSEPAERRVLLVEILGPGLRGEDADFLETLRNDRSDRVQALARLYLARLGRQGDMDPLTAELADMLEVRGSKRPDGRAKLTINTLKNAAQNARRRDLFTLVSLAGLARALGLTEEEIVAAAPVGAPEGVASFVQTVATTGSAPACRMLLDQMLADGAFPLAFALPLGSRLTREEIQALQPLFLKRDAETFETTLAFVGRALGAAPVAEVLASPSYAALTSAVEAARGEDEAERRAADAILETGLRRLALLADAPAAAVLLAHLTARGLASADPRLDLMHFNAALASEVVS